MGVGPQAIVRLVAAAVVGLEAAATAATAARRTATQFIAAVLAAAIVEPTEAAPGVGPVVGI